VKFPHGFRKKAFTLLEVLVATAVLGMVLVVVLQITNGILGATLAQRQQTDSVAAARRALDVISVDLQTAVAGNTAAILVPASGESSNLFALVTSRGGPVGSSGHRFLAVRYSTNDSSQLIRQYASVNYTVSNLLESAVRADSTTNHPLASGILQIRIKALADGMNAYPVDSPPSPNWSTNNYNGLAAPSGFKALLGPRASFASGLTNRTRALEVSIAAVDSQNLQILSQIGKLATARSALAGDPANWRTSVDSADIPATSKSGIRILKKTIPLP